MNMVGSVMYSVMYTLVNVFYTSLFNKSLSICSFGNLSYSS